jgi:ribonuclease VapC
LETGMVMEARKGGKGGEELDVFFARSEIEIFPMNAEQWEIARSGWRFFGKGRHPAGLNMGDCCAYALAKYLDEPILFKGNDFSKTDLKIVAY